MDIQNYVESGNLELYSLGIADPQVAEEIGTLRFAYPEIDQELREIELTMEKLADSQAVTPRRELKDRIMVALNFGEETIDLDNLPSTSKYSNYQSWLKAVAHLIPAEPFEDFFAHMLRQDEKIAQTLVVTKLNVPEEMHEKIAESFFILKGICTCTVGTEIFTLNAGDYLDIPLHTDHDIRIDSPYVVAILQHKFS